MDFKNWSSIRRIGIVLVGMFLVGFGLGSGLAVFEDSFPEGSLFWIFLGFLTVAGVAGFGYYRRLQQAGIADERSKQIRYKATVVSWTAVMIGISVVLGLLVFTDINLPMVGILWGLLVGSIVLQQMASEYLRRRM